MYYLYMVYVNRRRISILNPKTLNTKPLLNLEDKQEGFLLFFHLSLFAPLDLLQQSFAKVQVLTKIKSQKSVP